MSLCDGLFRFFSVPLSAAVCAGLWGITGFASAQPLTVQTNPIINTSTLPKFALLVGIAQYERKGFRPLHGPLNDVRDMRQELIDDFGFKPENVLVLSESQATRQNVIDAFHRQLRDNARRFPNGTFLFYYTGHGSRTRDLNGDEKQADPKTACRWHKRRGI